MSAQTKAQKTFEKNASMMGKAKDLFVKLKPSRVGKQMEMKFSPSVIEKVKATAKKTKKTVSDVGWYAKKKLGEPTTVSKGGLVALTVGTGMGIGSIIDRR